jgi:hypothetical protein
LATEFRVGIPATAMAYGAGRWMIDDVLMAVPSSGSRLSDL